MYPAPFDYFQAGFWREAVDLLSRLGDEAKVLAALKARVTGET